MQELFFKPNNVETKIKREVGKLFFKPNNITIDDIDRFEKIEKN